MEHTTTIEPTPQLVTDMLWELDSKQVAEVFKLWNDKFEQTLKECIERKEQVHIFDLPHFMLYVIKDMDDETRKIISSMYSHLVYTICDDAYRKHILL